ncbi:TIGR03986 family type III CRISPR-associated RAMP protein [Campylobacter canadensis]|uniref:TIGR03986 family CRISPR-associated RAMP protein n=1 Tax=Campylobacter canadensis TaxID=449520 RepID=A0ABS7WTC0_9BACT|nr:TIGR03986 family CRISPR-associated RAMP protein [Campylobacter canadensis]MBZ7987778.1 TIGR03986 family CRISPR-associated RAMP protein [Campylobacter canadensis]MBZ7998575.1 TIGR03986 family CRISPR-associated RAMP protein [Campylobacter canadensis]
MSFNKNFNNKAHAPYNFIPLNEKVAKFSASCILDDNKHNSFNTLKGISGEINLIITTKTPFFIGDSEKESNKDYKEFFSVDGKPQIPGSSLRGMIRNLVEIVSYGKFETYNNDKFYYRNMAGEKDDTLKAQYLKIMSKEENKKFVFKADKGYLVKLGFRKYAIYSIPQNAYKKHSFYDGSAKFKDIFNDNSKKQDLLKWCRVIINKNMQMFEYKDKIDVYTGTLGDKVNESFNSLKSAKKTYFSFKKYTKEDLEELVSSNKIKKIMLNYNDIKTYNADNDNKPQRKAFLDIVKMADNGNFNGVIPCFYTNYEGNIYFGHTPYFRIPYFKSVKEHVPEYEFGKNEFDLTECIFGKESAFATRVFFEDAKLGENKGDVFAKDVRSAVLMEPKPTSFNMYLENKVGAKLSQIKHYNDEVNIRGYKMYHHKTKISDNLGNGNDNVTSKIHEINSNVVFNGKIRFTNLKDYELGALMFVLNLPKNCFHKLGGAKPLGFGSVEIKASLSVYDITKSYENLFSENGKCELRLSDEKKDFKKAFESEILRQIGSKNTSLWEEPRLKELEIILNYEKSKGINSEYMGFSKKETILPHPSELVKNK